MLRPVRFSSLAILFALPFAALSQQTTQAPPRGPSRDSQAVSFLQNSFAALVGTATINSGLTLRGTAAWIAGSDIESGTATLKATAIGQGRIDLVLSGGERSEVRDTSASPPTGSWCGPDAIWHAISDLNLQDDPTWFFPAFFLGRLGSNTTYMISPPDLETKEGVAVQHISVFQQAQGSASPHLQVQPIKRFDVYLNSSDLFPVAVDFNIHPDNDGSANIAVEIRFSDYRSIQGAMIPYRIQKYLQNGLVLDLTIQTIQLNPGLSAAEFAAP